MSEDGTTPALKRAFGLALRSIRQNKRLSQGDLADKMQMQLAYVSELERGKRDPSLSMVYRAARALGIRPSSLIREIDRQMGGLTMPRTPVENAIKVLRDFMDQSPEMKWLGSPYAKTVYCNSPMLHYLGLTLAHLEGKSAWQELIHPDDRKQYVAKNTKAYAGREPQLSRYRMRGADGQYRVFVEHSVPQFTSKGLFIGFLGTMIQEPQG